MKSVKMIPDVLASAAADRWYVTDGATAVGPVEFELLARGVEAGRVPVESFVRHDSWKVWRPLTEIAVVSGVTPAPASRKRGALSLQAPAPEPSTDDITSPGRPALPEDQSPDDAFAGAADLEDALLLLMAAAVQRTASDAAVVHRVAREHGGPIAVCAHGAEVVNVLGARASLVDPVVIAAAAGTVVVAEPTPGPTGAALLARIARLGAPVEAAFMIPIRPGQRLLGMLELGRARPYRAADVAAAEALVDALEVAVLGRDFE